MKCALFLPLLFLTACTSNAPRISDDWYKDSIATMEESRYFGMQLDCLHPTQSQREQLAANWHGRSLYQIQQYLGRLATTPEEVACQQRALATCEKTAPGLCLAPPDQRTNE